MSIQTDVSWRERIVSGVVEALPRDRRLLILDLALLVAAALMILTDAVVFFFHLIFILLTFGAFYWKFRPFALRAGLWVTVTTVVVLTAIVAGKTQAEEISEIPLLTAILLVVFAMAKQRAAAQTALRKANQELEQRIIARTADLAREVAEHKRTAETLRESEARYRGLVELSFEAIAIHSDGRLLYVNRPGVELLGATGSEELVGREIRDFVHPEHWDLVQARMQQIGQEGIGVPLVEERLIRLDGTGVDVEVASVPVTYQGQRAIHTVIRDVTARKRAEAERARERARIARDLHASLGHSLGYLHLKLDQLAGEATFSNGTHLRRDLAQMRDVADEAYEVVRGMLAAALPSNATDLASALLVRARSAGQRAGFQVQCTSRGRARPLAPVVQQQLLYLFQEALANVEKHAGARQVHVDLNWGEEALTISLVDDGRGFDLHAPQPEGHFGLQIMRERAAEVQGDLDLRSRHGGGTEVVLRLGLSPARSEE